MYMKIGIPGPEPEHGIVVHKSKTTKYTLNVVFASSSIRSGI